MRKIFFAFELSARAGQALQEVQRDLREVVRIPTATFLPEESWHITTHFVGDVNDEIVEELITAMKFLPQEPISMSFTTVQLFPAVNHPRMIVVGLDDASLTAFAAHRAHFPILLRANLEIDTRPWRPHVTLVRLRGTHGAGQLVYSMDNIHVPNYTFSVPRITLFESLPGHNYMPLASIDLPMPIEVDTEL